MRAEPTFTETAFAITTLNMSRIPPDDVQE